MKSLNADSSLWGKEKSGNEMAAAPEPNCCWFWGCCWESVSLDKEDAAMMQAA